MQGQTKKLGEMLVEAGLLKPGQLQDALTHQRVAGGRMGGILAGLGTDAMTVAMLEETRVALWGQHLRANNPSCAFMEVAGAITPVPGGVGPMTITMLLANTLESAERAAGQ